MERHSSKRKHYGQLHNREFEQRRPSEAEKRASGDSKRRRAHEELSRDTIEKPPLSEDADYVRRWLAQIDKEIEAVDTNMPRAQEKTGRHDTKRMPHLELQSFRNSFHETDDTKQKYRHVAKRRHRSFSDSSLLETVVKPEPKLPSGEPKVAPERREAKVSHKEKKRQVAQSDSTSSADLHVHHETFEKRERHKTREDRYEPRKKKYKSDKRDEEPKRKKRREKKGDKNKAAKKAGEDLMNNFSSKNVAHDRLTIRSHGPGLFKNGRASSPARRRGLPDLVFSEMEFLQHPPRPSDLQSSSKIREKENRRAAREQEEISMFFRSTKAPLAETSPNVRRERSVAHRNDKQSMYVKLATMDQPQNRTENIDLLETRYPRLGQPGVSSDRLSAFRGHTPSIHRLRTAPTTTSRLSKNATTAVTWSETQVSPEATAESRRRNHNHQHHGSPTPEPIRRSIENTGIFRDTGIGRTPSLTSSRAKPTPHNGLYKNQLLGDVQDPQDYSNRTGRSATSQSRRASSYSKLSTSAQQPESRDQTPQTDRNPRIMKEAAAEPLSRKKKENRSVDIGDPAESQRGQGIVDHSDPNIGWHRQQDRLEENLATAPVGIETLRESKGTFLTREEIAKDARIKCPASIIPAETVSGEPNPYDEKKAPLSQQPVCERNHGNQRFINNATMEHVVHTVSVETSDAPGEFLWHPSLKNSNAIHPGNDAHESYKMETELPLGNFHSTSVPPQFGRWLDCSSREGIPVSGNENPRLGSAKFDTTAVAGLPVRRPSCGCFGQPPPHPLRLPPEVEPAPLYLNQIRRQFISEQPTLENGMDNYQAENNWNLINSEMVPCFEENEYGMLEDQDYEAHSFAGYPIGGEEEDLEYYAEHDTHETQPWQPLAQDDDDMMEHFQTGYGLNAHMSNDYEVNNGRYDDQGAAEAYTMEERGAMHKYQVSEEVPMLGFWRRNRPF